VVRHGDSGCTIRYRVVPGGRTADRYIEGVILKRVFTSPWLVIALAVLILVGINAGYRVIVADLRETLDSELGRQLGGLAETFAATLDVADVRDAVASAETFDPDAYMRLRARALEFADVNRLVTATVLDSNWQDPFADAADSLGAKVYSLLDRDGRWAPAVGLTWVSQTFRWGDSYYRSAAAPVEDPVSGEFLAIARIEVDARHFGALDRLDQLAWWIHGLSAALALALVALFLWQARLARRWERELLRSEKLIGLGRLAATIAHEIKNPLGIIKATAQRLERTAGQNLPPEKREELLKFIPEEVDRLNRILTRYLQIAATDQSHPASIDVGGQLPEWIKSMPERDRLRLSLETTGPVYADREAPHQVTLNLIRNALEASPDGAGIEIEWTRNGRYGQLRVRDHGPGIPRKLRTAVFEPFYTTKASGSGLGLYAVKTLVERDGGQVAIEDNPGGGAAVIVRWPLASTTGGAKN
jgi:signal transduction histidine kinase